MSGLPGPDDEADGAPGSDLERAARSLASELRETTRLHLVGKRCFTPARAPGPAYEHLADLLARAGAAFLGDFTVDGAGGFTLRAGVADDGATVALVVAPPDRPPYVELTTWWGPSDALTTSGRSDAPAAARPKGLLLERRPALDPVGLLAHHRLAVRAIAAGRRARRVGLAGGKGGVLHAVHDYLAAFGC